MCVSAALSDEDFKHANAKSTETIAIDTFCDAEEIQPIYYDTPYYVTVRGTRLRGRSRLTAIGAGGMPPALEPPSSGERCRRPVLQSAVRAVLAAVHPLVRSSFEPLFRTGSAVRTARPTTRTAFAGLKILDRALDSAAARCFLFGRDDPTNPFVGVGLFSLQ